MAMVVKNNMTAINTLNTLNKNSSALSKSLQKVSSGMKINSAADDASGYAISERMRVQIRSLDQANQNTQNGSSMMKVAEGAVSSTVEILKTLKEKAVNAANDSNTDSDRQTIQKELDQSIDQINDNANVTFNGKYLVDGSKNTIGNATYTALSNQSLSTDTTATTKLTALEARSGDSLEIHDTDKVTVSYVQGGKTYSTTFNVKDEKTGEIASLQDIFKKAEDIDKTNQIFADSSNKSVLAAQVADGVITKEQADGIQVQIDKAKDDYNQAKVAYDAAVAGMATEQDTVEAEIKDYNDASTAWNAALGGNGTGYAAKAIAIKDAADDADYMDKVAKSAQYKAVADNTTNSMDTTITELGTAATDAVAAGVTDVTGAVAAAKAALATTADKADIEAALDAFAATANNKNEIGAFLTDLATKATAVKTAQEALVNGSATSIIDKAGAAVAGSKYADYLTAKPAYDTAKATYDGLVGPKLLEGETVGVAASDDVATTASSQKAITITANKEGIGGQISGLNISISDSQGNVKKSANAALDAFEETIRAQNKSDDNAISLQVGAKANQSIKVGLTDMRAEALGLQGADGSKLNISTQTKANAAINVLDNAIQKALDQQTTIGSVESRLEYTSTNLTTASENVQASESTIRDADMAKEMTNYTKNNVLLQAAQSMLAQANQSSSNVLSLLQ